MKHSGRTYQEIGQTLNTSRQNAHQLTKLVEFKINLDNNQAKRIKDV
jgi:hypothetical protein